MQGREILNVRKKKKMGRIINLYKKFGGSKLLKEYLKTGFLFRAPFQVMSSGLSNKGLELLRLSAQLRLYNYLKKRYWKFMDTIDFSKYPSEHKHSNKVWVCWFQGMGNAPLVVQRCYESMQKNLKKEDIILLTDENLGNYVTFPDFIIEKYKNGAITKTHLTDLLRLELLSKYGGVWIDSTVLCTGEIPQYIIDSDFFVFRCLKPGRDGVAVPISSWYMEATTNNRIVIAVKELMYEYWKRNNTLIDYFLIHNFIQMALEKYPEEEKKMVKSPNDIPHILLLDIFEPFNAQKYKVIKSMTPIHKLAYKRSKEDMSKKATYFDEIINKGNY
jgi:hypothetical protein